MSWLDGVVLGLLLPTLLVVVHVVRFGWRAGPGLRGNARFFLFNEIVPVRALDSVLAEDACMRGWPSAPSAPSASDATSVLPSGLSGGASGRAALQCASNSLTVSRRCERSRSIFSRRSLFSARLVRCFSLSISRFLSRCASVRVLVDWSLEFDSIATRSGKNTRWFIAGIPFFCGAGGRDGRRESRDKWTDNQEPERERNPPLMAVRWVPGRRSRQTAGAKAPPIWVARQRGLQPGSAQRPRQLAVRQMGQTPDADSKSPLADLLVRDRHKHARKNRATAARYEFACAWHLVFG